MSEGDLLEPNVQEALYGANYDRLYSLKQRYDPWGCLCADSCRRAGLGGPGYGSCALFGIIMGGCVLLPRLLDHHLEERYTLDTGRCLQGSIPRHAGYHLGALIAM